MFCTCNGATGSDLPAEPGWSCKLLKGTGIGCLALVRVSWPFMKIMTASALLVCWQNLLFLGQLSCLQLKHTLQT